jgi:protein TonB
VLPLRSGTAPRPPARAADELGRSGRHLLIGGVLLAHLAGGWALMQVQSVREAVVEVAPLMVSLIAPAPLPKPPAPAPAPARQPVKAPAPAPLIAAAPTATPAPPTFVAPPVEAVAAPVAVSAEPVAPAPVPAVSAPPAPKQLPSSAVRYLVEPQLTVPLLSRRLGEQGLVQVRVLVDVRGRLKEVSLKKSSGFARLDQQALQDIRSARFAPHLENGQPIEWEATALLSYELDR